MSLAIANMGLSVALTYHGRFVRIAASVLLIAVFVGGQLSHAAGPPGAGSTVNRLVDVSGMAYATRQILPSILSGMDEPLDGVPVEMRAGLRDAATQAFQPDPIIERITARLGATLTARQLDDALAWLESPAGLRITALENEAAEPTAAERMQAYGRELEQNPPAAQRVRLIGELNRASGSSEMAVKIMEAVVLATALGVNAALPVQQRVPVDAVRQQVKASLPQLRREADKMVMLNMLYAYRSLSDPELEAYLGFLNSSSGAAYAKGALAAVGDAMLEAIGRFMAAIPKALEKHKGAIGA